jgi:hypothetical protein
LGIDVDVIKRLPTPYRLVRYGIVADNPDIEREFMLLFDVYPPNNKVDDAITTLLYFGNVDIGRDMPLSVLQSMHDVVILAFGMQSSNRRQRIPRSGNGEFDGVLSAPEFLLWCNVHPKFVSVSNVVGRCLWGGQSIGVAGGDEDDNDISPARVVV